MNTYLTEHPAHSLGRWLATLAVSLVLLALAYAQAPHPAEYLGLSLPRPRPLPNSHHAPGVAQALASTEVSPPARVVSHAQFAR